MPYRCKNWSGDYDGMVYQSWTDASKRADQLEKVYGGTWSPTEVTDTSNNDSSSFLSYFVTLLKFIFLFLRERKSTFHFIPIFRIFCSGGMAPSVFPL